MEPHDSVKKVYLLLALGALVVTLVGVFAGQQNLTGEDAP
jgi:hypothetical protein